MKVKVKIIGAFMFFEFHSFRVYDFLNLLLSQIPISYVFIE